MNVIKFHEYMHVYIFETVSTPPQKPNDEMNINTYKHSLKQAHLKQKIACFKA